MEKASDAQERYQILHERFGGLESKIRGLDRSADGRLIQAIAEGAHDVAAALPRLRDLSADQAQAAARLAADGLDRLSNAFLSGAESLHLLPESDLGKKGGINAKIKHLHAQAVELAQDHFLKALAFREAGGIEQPPERWAFHFPQLSECDDKEVTACQTTEVLLFNRWERRARCNS